MTMPEPKQQLNRRHKDGDGNDTIREKGGV